MSQLHLLLFSYLAASASCFSLPQDFRVTHDDKLTIQWSASKCLYFQNFPLDEETPEYEIVEITPKELEAFVNMKDPEQLMYPADYLEVLQGNTISI